MGGGKFDRDAKRAEIMAISMEVANEPRFGYFGYTSPLAVGEDSGAPRSHKVTEDEFRKPNIQASTTKKGSTLDTLFLWYTPICVGDPYKARAGAVKRERAPLREGQEPFHPAGASKFGLSGGIEWIPSAEKRERRQKVEPVLLPNIVTGPSKRGGGGVYTPGVLFGFGEEGERKWADWMPDDYNIASKLRREELKRIGEMKIHETGFKGCGYGNKTFDTIDVAYACADKDGNLIPYGVPMPKQDANRHVKQAHHEMAWHPNGGIKTGHDACCMPFPEWMPDPIPMPAKRKAGGDEKDRESWRVGAPSEQMNPSPAVQMLSMNLRRDFPKSFARPQV